MIVCARDRLPDRVYYTHSVLLRAERQNGTGRERAIFAESRAVFRHAERVQAGCNIGDVEFVPR